MSVNAISRVGLAFILFLIGSYLFPLVIEKLSSIGPYPFHSPYLEQLLCGIYSLLCIWTLSGKSSDYGFKIVSFDWRRVLLIVFSIQLIPILAFLAGVATNTLLLSDWMQKSLFEITVVYLLLSPLVEEVYFRGLIQTLFAPLLNYSLRMGDVVISVPVLLTAILFTLVHVYYSILALVFIFALGILCGLLREKHGSVVPGVVAHAVFNLLAVLLPRAFLLILEAKH